MPPQGRPQAVGRSSQTPARGVRDFSRGRPRRSTPQHAWNCAIYFASFVGGGRSSQFQPGKYAIFQAGGCPTRKPARSQPEASQKPTKPLFLIARSQPNQASRAWALQGVKEVQPFSGRPRRSTPGLLRKPTRVELCHLLCFVCGRGSASTRPPRQRGGPASFSQVRGLIWQGSLGLAGS